MTISPKITRIGVVGKWDDPKRVRIVQHVVDYLAGKAEVFVTPDLAKALGDVWVGTPLGKMPVDAVVTVGGDGTILWAMQNNPAPVFSINVGELGYLTEIEPFELTDGLGRLLAGDYVVEERLKLETWLDDERLPNALNEVVVKTVRPSKILNLEVEYGGQPYRLKADGVIVSTPTGSTSYAMSAGGPIVDPRVECILLVPLAAFSFSWRPVVVPRDAEVRIRVRNKDGAVVVDGQTERPLGTEATVTVRAARERARFVRFRTHDLGRLRDRLG